MNAPNDVRADKRSDREVIEEHLGEHRHVLKKIVEIDGPLKEDAATALEMLGEDVDRAGEETPPSAESAGSDPVAQFCPSCGESIDSEDQYCRYCGGEL